MTKITTICQECERQFDYELKPGFPRKYCIDCSAKKKAEFDGVPVVKPGVPVIDAETGIIKHPAKVFPKDPVGLAVEIYCANRGSERFNEIINGEIMTDAIALVKQAQEAFN